MPLMQLRSIMLVLNVLQLHHSYLLINENGKFSKYDSDSKERMGLVISPNDLKKIEEICQRENAPIYVVGKVKENSMVMRL